MKKVEKKYFGYYASITSHCIHSEQEDVQYGSWSEEWSNTMDQMCMKKVDYPNVASTLDIPAGSNALVVWAEWSTGDSFGRAENGSAEPFGIFTDINAAKAFADWLKDLKEDTKKSDYVGLDGQVIEAFYVPW